jgi:iron(III) transport system substrate-binding protein
MKKTIALLLTLVMVFALFSVSAHADGMDDLIAAAKADGELVVYGSCEEDYLAAACQNFEKLYGIKTTYQRLSTGEVPAKIEEENGKPSADVWFGGTNNPYDGLAAKGFLDNSYVPQNASHLTKDI